MLGKEKSPTEAALRFADRYEKYHTARERTRTTAARLVVRANPVEY